MPAVCPSVSADLNYVEDSGGGPDLSVGYLPCLDKVTLLQVRCCLLLVHLPMYSSVHFRLFRLLTGHFTGLCLSMRYCAACSSLQDSELPFVATLNRQKALYCMQRQGSSVLLWLLPDMDSKLSVETLNTSKVLYFVHCTACIVLYEMGFGTPFFGCCQMDSKLSVETLDVVLTLTLNGCKALGQRMKEVGANLSVCFLSLAKRSW